MTDMKYRLSRCLVVFIALTLGVSNDSTSRADDTLANIPRIDCARTLWHSRANGTLRQNQ